jgi:perosamine synthetase
MTTPLIPVSRPDIGEEELQAVREVFTTRWLGMGAVTKKFEDAVANFLGGSPVSQVVAINTGTTALHLALDVAGIGRGDEVIVPSLTFAATIQVITALGAIPVFCDVEENTLNLDLTDAARCVSPKTKAIIPVHYRGVPCDMDGIAALAQRHHFRVIEDAAHAFGSSYKERRIGAFGDLTCFSFDPIKNITCGEGGAIITRDSKLAERLRRTPGAVTATSGFGFTM